MTDQTQEAAVRVAAFLDARDRMGGPIDRAVIHSIGRRDQTFELRTEDLRALAELAAAMSTGVIVTAVAGGPPDCPEHRERQHRDGLAPWCPKCGWNHGQAAVPPRKLGNPRNR